MLLQKQSSWEHERGSFYQRSLEKLRRLLPVSGGADTPWSGVPRWEGAQDADDVLEGFAQSSSLHGFYRELGIGEFARRHRGFCRFSLGSQPAIYIEHRSFRKGSSLLPLTHRGVLAHLRGEEYQEPASEAGEASVQVRLEQELLERGQLRPFLLHLQRALRRASRENVYLENLILYCVLDGFCRLEGIFGLQQKTLADILWEQPGLWSKYRNSVRAQAKNAPSPLREQLEEGEWLGCFDEAMEENIQELVCAPENNLLRQWFQADAGCFPKSRKRYKAFVHLKSEAHKKIARRCLDFCTSGLLAELVHGFLHVLQQAESHPFIKEGICQEIPSLIEASYRGERAGLEHLRFTRDVVLEGIRHAPSWDGKAYLATRSQVLELSGTSIWLPKGTLLLVAREACGIPPSLLPAPHAFSTENIRILRAALCKDGDDCQRLLYALGSRSTQSLSLNVTLQSALLALVYAGDVPTTPQNEVR